MRVLPLLLALALTTAAAELEKADLFTGGEGGFASYRIPGIVTTARGVVLAYCEARRTSAADWGEIEVHLRRSTDGGRTWEAPRQIAHFGERLAGLPTEGTEAATQQTVNNPVMIATRDGTVHLLYCINYARAFAQHSGDDGATWSQPVEITAAFDAFRPEYDWKVLATGPAHGIELRRGRLVVPVWLCRGTGGAHQPSVTSVIFSDDRGATWQRGEIVAHETEPLRNPNETVAVELADGSVLLNIRHQGGEHRRAVSVSQDGATGWSRPVFDHRLLEPICMASIVRASWEPSRIVFANPDHLDRADGRVKIGGGRDRRNLSLKLSTDEGKTWSHNRVLEPGASGYSDLAVLPDGAIGCFYERGKSDTDKNYAARLTFARVPLEWITGK
jgi:sialidase-1